MLHAALLFLRHEKQRFDPDQQLIFVLFAYLFLKRKIQNNVLALFLSEFHVLLQFIEIYLVFFF